MHAQESAIGSDKYRIGITLHAGPPHPFGNKAFRNTFVGAYEIGGEVEFGLFDKFYVAPSYSHTAWRVPVRKIADRLPTILHFENGGVSIGYKNYFSEKGFWTAALGGGINYSHYRDVLVPDSLHAQKTFNSSYLQAEVSINFYSEDNFTLGFFTTYTVLADSFDPKAAHFTLYRIYDPSESSGNIKYINLGFSLRYMLWKKGKGST